MAHIQSAKKRIRSSEARRVGNLAVKTRVKTARRKTAEALSAGSITFHHPVFIDPLTYEKQKSLSAGHFGVIPEDWAGFVRETPPDVDPDFLAEEIRRLKKTSSNVRVFFYPNFPEREMKAYYAQPASCGSNRKGRCLSPWLQSYIFPDGTVRPCLSLNYAAGNIRSEVFTRIWNNPDYVRFRRIAKKEGFFPVCPRCTEYHRF